MQINQNKHFNKLKSELFSWPLCNQTIIFTKYHEHIYNGWYGEEEQGEKKENDNSEEEKKEDNKNKKDSSMLEM